MEGKQYELKIESRTEKGKEIYKFGSSDGIVSKNKFRDPELLLADEVRPKTDDNILIFQPGFGFLGVIMADLAPNGETVLASTSDRGREVSGNNIETNDIGNATTITIPSPENLKRESEKILYAPKPYDPVDLVKKQIVELAELLKEDGKLYISGDKNSGINRYRDLLKEMSGETKKIDQRDGNRAYTFRPEGQIAAEKPEIENSFSAEIKGVKADFRTAEGLFSTDRIDPGSRLLIENIEFSEGKKVLDLACGYGAIGLFLEKLYDIDICLSDDSALGTHYAEINLEQNSIDNYRLETADCLDGFSDEKFDVIVSNPPTHQGKGITSEIIENSFKRLRKGGKLWLVFQKKSGLETKLREEFGRVKIITEKEGYLVTRAKKV